MKKIIVFFILSFIFISHSKSQEINYSALTNQAHYLYVGSLPKNSVHVYEKLKIEVFGGTYSSNNLATTTYSIGSRDYNKINIERTGGGAGSFELVIYENGTAYDFVIQTTKQYASLNIKSTLLTINSQHDNIMAKHNIDIKKYDPSGKKNVSSDFMQTIMSATDMYGNLGIGTLSPEAKLDVRGNIIADRIKIREALTLQNDLILQTGGLSTTPLLSEGKRLYFGADGDNGDRMYIARFNRENNKSDLRINIGDDREGDDRFVIGNTYWNSGGIWKNWVVISSRGLDVNGTIRSHEVKIEATEWSDFVFDSDYKLPNLTDVENHIKTHKHLPDIPSEKEVIENGINIGEMQAKLLQKIEELTLYVIDLKKENEAIKEEIKILKKE